MPLRILPLRERKDEIPLLLADDVAHPRVGLVEAGVAAVDAIAFDNRLAEFKKLGAELIGISVDSQYTHYAWKNTPVEKGGFQSAMTQALKSALQLVDVRVLDHLVVGRGAVVSFAERGLL